MKPVSRNVHDQQQEAHLFGVRLDILTYEELDERIQRAITQGMTLRITAPHFFVLLLARREQWLRDFLNGCSINYIDGLGTWLGIRMLSRVRPPRINGTDYHFSLLHYALRRGLRVFLLGGSMHTAGQLSAELKQQYPDAPLHVHHGTIDIDDSSVVHTIRQFQPDLLFLGLGTPFQFAWMQRHTPVLDVPVTLATGAFLDFAAGTRPRAPRWLRRIGFEWLHRLLHEPRRLWRRYILGIPTFIYFVLREKLQRRN